LKKRLVELENMLLSRGYNKNMVKETTAKALSLDRTEVLKKVTKTKKERVVLAVTYHPKLPSASSIISKHWRTLSKDQKAKEIFPLSPMVAFKQPPNLTNKLVHEKLPNQGKTKKQVTCTKQCNKPCGICPYVLQSKEFISTSTKERFLMKGTFTCNTKGLIYLTTCSKCLIQYVGQTARRLLGRVKEHLNCICLQKRVTGVHYNSSGDNHYNFQVQVIEKVSPNTPNFRLEREDVWIKKAFYENTIRPKQTRLI
jgi:hypothetical protein